MAGGLGMLATAVLAVAVSSAAVTADPATPDHEAAPQSPRVTVANGFQEYQFSCPGGNPLTIQETCNFSPTPAGKFAKVQNASCLVNLMNAQLKFIKLLILEGDVVKSSMVLNHVVTYVDRRETWIAAHDRITAYVAAGQRVQIKAELFELPLNGNTNLFCHISGTY